jgi:hypothetical protein
VVPARAPLRRRHHDTTQTVAAFSARLREQVDHVSIDDRDRNEAGSRWPRCSTVVGS